MTQEQRRTQEDFFIKIFTSNFIARVWKGCVGFYCERELEINHNCNILTPKLMAVNVVSFSFFWCSTRGPGVHSAGCWLSLLHLISIFSGPQFIRASQGPLWPGLAFLTTSCLQLCLIFNSTGSSNSTELYNRSTPTRSLKSNV